LRISKAANIALGKPQAGLPRLCGTFETCVEKIVSRWRLIRSQQESREL
jgi:hypothetical protein